MWRSYCKFIQGPNRSNAYGPSSSTSKCTNQNMTEGQRETDKSTVTVRDFNNPFPILERASRLKLIKDIENLINTINQLNLSDSYRTRQPCYSGEPNLSMCVYKCAKTDHSLGQSTSLNQSKGFKWYRECSLTTTELNWKSGI